MELKTFSK